LITNTYFNAKFRKFLILQSFANYYKSSIAISNKINNVNDFTMTNNLIFRNEKHGLMIGLQYQKSLFHDITPQGYNKWGNDFWLTFIQKTFLEDKLTVMAYYFLPLSFGLDFAQGSYLETDTYTEDVVNDISLLKNIVMLEISYRFSKGKTVNKNEKEIEIENQKKSNGLF